MEPASLKLSLGMAARPERGPADIVIVPLGDIGQATVNRTEQAHWGIGFAGIRVRRGSGGGLG